MGFALDLQMKFALDAWQNVVSDQLTVIFTIYSIRFVKQALMIGSFTTEKPRIRIADIVASLAMHEVLGFVSKDDHFKFYRRCHRCVDLRCLQEMAVAEFEKNCHKQRPSYSYQISEPTVSPMNCYWCWEEIVIVIWPKTSRSLDLR